MKEKIYIKKFLMIGVSIFIYFTLMMFMNESYAGYGEVFKTFLVKSNDGTLRNGKTTVNIEYDGTYEIPYSISFDAIENYVNEKCKDKKGNIDSGKIQKVFENYTLDLDEEKFEEAQNDDEVKVYEHFSEIIGKVRVCLVNKKENESLEDALKRTGVYSEIYNDDGTIDTDNSSNSLPTKEELLNYDYSKIYAILNNMDGENIYWDGNSKKCKIIDDNSNLSDSDKREIKNKWAQVAVDVKSSDGNVKAYLDAEIKAIKAERYYRDPNVTTSTADGGIDDVISDGDSFIGLGSNDKVQVSDLQAFSKNIYNILLTIGIVVAVISGIIIGIKYMLGSVEEKADIKGLLISYIAGCVIVFGAFAIWKLVVTILQGV